DTQIGADRAQADIAAVRHAADGAVEIGLHVGRGFLDVHGPGGSRLALPYRVGIERLPVRLGVVHGVGIDRPEGDPRTEQVGVLLPVVGQRPGRVGDLQRRDRAGAEIALCVAGGARTAVQDHVGADVTHQATVRIAGAHAGVYGGDQRVPDVVRMADAVAHAEIELDAGSEVVVPVEAKHVEGD